MTDFFYKDKRIGSLKEGVFRKQVKKSKHLMRMNDSWGIQLDALNKLKDSGCTEIRIWETEENKVYSIPFEKLWKEGQVMLFDGEQAFLPRSEWTITNK
jgi:hypothetical protein